MSGLDKRTGGLKTGGLKMHSDAGSAPSRQPERLPRCGRPRRLCAALTAGPPHLLRGEAIFPPSSPSTVSPNGRRPPSPLPPPPEAEGGLSSFEQELCATQLKAEEGRQEVIEGKSP